MSKNLSSDKKCYSSSTYISYYEKDTDSLLRYSVRFISDPEPLINSIKVCDTLTSNGRNSSYSLEGSIDDVKIVGTLFKTVNPSKRELNGGTNIAIVEETYDEYLNKMKQIGEHNLKWIYNVINGVAESDNIIYQNDEFVLMTDYTWDKKVLQDFHLLAIVRDRAIMSMRDLRREHIPMLKDIHEKVVDKIEEMYGFNRSSIRSYLHYPPSTYLLHIHFTHVNKCDAGTIFDRAFDLHTVIRNIELDEDYYRSTLRIIDTVD